jgi:hypothetical protein
MAKLNDFKRRVTPRKVSLNNDSGACRAATIKHHQSDS